MKFANDNREELGCEVKLAEISRDSPLTGTTSRIHLKEESRAPRLRYCLKVTLSEEDDIAGYQGLSEGGKDKCPELETEN